MDSIRLPGCTITVDRRRGTTIFKVNNRVMIGACSAGARQVKPAKKPENKCAIFSMLHEVNLKEFQSIAELTELPWAADESYAVA
ncbi:hypothetical protein D3C80_1869980 [compost metagenome]